MVCFSRSSVPKAFSRVLLIEAASVEQLFPSTQPLNDYRLKAGRLWLRLKVAGLRLKPPEDCPG
jgi:hypothetical protein